MNKELVEKIANVIHRCTNEGLDGSEKHGGLSKIVSKYLAEEILEKVNLVESSQLKEAKDLLREWTEHTGQCWTSTLHDRTSKFLEGK
jgi:hypothetical protein